MREPCFARLRGHSLERRARTTVVTELGPPGEKLMQRSSIVIRAFGLLLAAVSLVTGGIVSGCGPEAGPTYEPEPGVSKPAKAIYRGSGPPKSLPKTVNPKASNRGIKGKYAD
jgi:hypothetical protein